MGTMQIACCDMYVLGLGRAVVMDMMTYLTTQNHMCPRVKHVPTFQDISQIWELSKQSCIHYLAWMSIPNHNVLCMHLWLVQVVTLILGNVIHCGLNYLWRINVECLWIFKFSQKMFRILKLNNVEPY